MATPNSAVLDTVLNTFRTQIDSGFGVLQGPVEGTFGTLIVISVVLMALFWSLDESGMIYSKLIRKILVIGWWAYLILNWQTTAISVFTAFGALGVKAGGLGSLSDFLNHPSKVVGTGLTNAKAFFDLADYYMGNSNKWGDPPVTATGLDIGASLRAIVGSLVLAAEAGFTAIITLAAFCWLALEIVVVTIEFHIVILMGFCILPFGVYERTASYAERVLSYVIGAGFKVMALGIVIGLSSTFLTNNAITYTPGALPGLDQMVGVMLSGIIVLMLAISAPKYAAALMSGSPSTGMGNLAAAGGMVVGAGMAASGIAKGAFAGAQTVAGGASKAAAAMTRGGNAGGGSTQAASAVSPGSSSAAAASATSAGAESKAAVTDLAASMRSGGSAAPTPPPASPAKSMQALADTIGRGDATS